MLDGIDDIDWAQLGHAYGSAADVPFQILALRSADETVRVEALHELYGNIFHQGTRYEATAYAVPFLLELVADRGTPDRAAIVALLGAIAIGYDSTWLPDQLPIAEHRAAAQGGDAVLARMHEPREEDPDGEDDEDLEEGEEYEDEFDDRYEEFFGSLSEQDEGKLYAYVAVRAYDAVRAGVPVLLEALGDPEPGLRTAAAYALGWFPEDADAILPRLIPSTSDDEVALATALVSTGLLGGRPDAALLHDPRPLVRWGAAVALRDPAELAAWVTGDAPTDPRIPFLDGDLGGVASLALGELGAEAAFDAVLVRIPKVSGSEALAAAAVALRLAFPDGPIADGQGAGSLDDRQRRLAQALAASPQTWRLDGMEFGNFSQLVGEYGLPRSATALREWL